MASLESIHLQDHLDGSPRFATMRPVLGALLVPGRGIKTHKLDSSFGGTGALLSDDMAFGIASRDPTRQLTVMSAHRSGEHRRDEEGREVFSPEHRPKRNLVVSGLTPQELEGAIGGKLMIGLEAEVVVMPVSALEGLSLLVSHWIGCRIPRTRNRGRHCIGTASAA